MGASATRRRLLSAVAAAGRALPRTAGSQGTWRGSARDFDALIGSEISRWRRPIRDANVIG